MKLFSAFATAMVICLLCGTGSAHPTNSQMEPDSFESTEKDDCGTSLQPEIKTNADSPVTFGLKPLNTKGPCAQLINGKLGVDSRKATSYCAANDDKEKFSLRADGSLWSQGMELTWNAADGEISAARPEYRAQSDTAQAQKFSQQSFKFEFIKCGNGKTCLVPTGLHQVNPKWEVINKA